MRNYFAKYPCFKICWNLQGYNSINICAITHRADLEKLIDSNILRKNKDYGGIIVKRVYCLYRVSTKKQVDKNDNDIPMQKTACHEFCERQKDWTIVKEFSEKGVSGFKVSADERDAIQELKEAALKNEFDILLVFMFDRIGRIDDETPFVVEWFVKPAKSVCNSTIYLYDYQNAVDLLVYSRPLYYALQTIQQQKEFHHRFFLFCQT